MPLVHTPYDGSKQPFTIGLEPLLARDWIEVDEHLVRDLNEKQRLIATRRDIVVREEADTRASQTEVLNLLLAHLPVRFPNLYARDDDAMRILPAQRVIALTAAGDPPLVTAARLVQEDLCLMRRNENGWRLAAAVLCFPSGWSLAEKLGQNLATIHAPIPGFAGRMDAVVTRIFDRLQVEAPLLRFNWSLYGDGELHHPPDFEPAARFLRPADMKARVHIRIERQTLRLLPGAGDILFTIRTHAEPIAALARHPRRRELALGLRAQLLGLDDAQAAYKGLTHARGALAKVLANLAEG